MRIFFFIAYIIVVIPSVSVMAQTNALRDTGNVGIGTLFPATTLDVNGYTQSAMYRFRGVATNSYVPHHNYGIYQEAGPWVHPFPKLVINYHTGIKMVGYATYGGMKFYTGYHASGEPTGQAMSIGDGDDNVRVNHSLFITENVGIGTSSTGSYKLAVEGTIGARKVKVTSVSPWPDYVFSKEYSLPSIASVEKYIAEHQHLSEIPSSAEVAADGIDLGEMNKKLLQKIEELTLYLIEEHKRSLKQQEQIDVLIESVNQLKSFRK